MTWKSNWQKQGCAGLVRVVSFCETPVRVALQVLGELSVALEAEEMSQNGFIRRPVVRVEFCFCFLNFNF